MKRTLFFLLLLAFLPFASVLQAQAPQAVTLQSVLRDAAGRLVSNRNVSVLISLRRGSNTGPVVYSETHTPTTNQNGLYTVFFGRGTAVTGNFASIDWALGPYYATVEADPTGGSNYTLTVSHPIVSVPYALFADTAAHAPTAGLAGNASHADTADYYREEQRLTIRHDTIHLSGGRDNPGGATWVKLPHDSLIHALDHIVDSLVNNPCIASVKTSTVAACERYTWATNQNVYTGSGTYINIIARGSSRGCDSIEVLVLTINNGIHNRESISATGSYTWHGTTYTTSGTKIYTYNSPQGCASADTLFLKINTLGTTPGEFTVASGKKVKFSKGNLQYRASDNNWRFAERQYDYVAEGNGNVFNSSTTNTLSNNRSLSSTYNGWIDLFGWGTSNHKLTSDNYHQRFRPWDYAAGSISTTYNYYGYGPSISMQSRNLTDGSSDCDWGVSNPISNGGNQVGLWRTLTTDEWKYVFSTRNASTVCGKANARYCHATVAGVKGMILFPDVYIHPATGLDLNSCINTNCDYSTKNILEAGWAEMEAAGAIFLPAAGYRENSPYMYDYNSVGYYWSSTVYSSSSPQTNAYYLLFSNNSLTVQSYRARYYGHAVRLVQDIQ